MFGHLFEQRKGKTWNPRINPARYRFPTIASDVRLRAARYRFGRLGSTAPSSGRSSPSAPAAASTPWCFRPRRTRKFPEVAEIDIREPFLALNQQVNAATACRNKTCQNLAVATSKLITRGKTDPVRYRGQKWLHDSRPMA